MTHSGFSSDPSIRLSPHGSSQLIFGSGEMADRVRAFDWASTPLGPIDTWPEILLTSVNTLLGSRHPLFLWWGQDLIQFYNDAYRPSLGRDKHPTALGQCGRVCWAEIWPTIGPEIEAALHRGESTWHEDRFLPVYRNGKDLQDAFWTYSYSPIRDAYGHIRGVLVVVSETTTRIFTERLQRSSEERLQLALEAADLGTWSYNPHDETFTADAAMQRIFGAPGPTGDLHYWQQILHPDDRLPAREEFAAALAGLRPYNIEYRILHPEGLRWIHSKGRVLHLEGETRGMFAIVEDITESKLAEIELHTRARDLRESQRIGRMGSWHLDLATTQLTWSEEVYCLMERDPSLPPFTPRENAAIFQDDSLERLHQATQHCIATREPYELDAALRLPSGTLLWLATRGEPVVDANGELIALRGTIRDITDRKLAENALRESEERLRLALAAARDIGTFDWDILPDRCIADHRFCTIFGIDPELGQRGLRMEQALANVHPEDWEQVENRARHTLDTGEDFVMDYRVQPSPGTVNWVSARGNCLRTADGTPVRFVGALLDITERKLAEQALVRTEKLAAVGRLASSIAHEINNPLESVTNLLYLARTVDDLNQSREYLAVAESELRRASAITSQTLRFHRQSTRPVSVTCLDILSPVVGIHQSRLTNSGISLEKRKRAQRSVSCLDGEIRQVVGNIIGNAIDAMHPTGGRLFIRSREGCDWRPAASGLPPRPGVILTLADTGPGMAPETLSKIFEPFFTTKGIAGTGLGLWISKEIMDRHQGTLSVRSSQHPIHHGTVFSVFLPFDVTPTEPTAPYLTQPLQ